MVIVVVAVAIVLVLVAILTVMCWSLMSAPPRC
jgi:hypothetical protein